MPTPLHFQIFRDVQQQWRWHLVSPNNRIIASSGEGYHNQNDCLDAIQIVKSTSNSRIWDQTTQQWL